MHTQKHFACGTQFHDPAERGILRLRAQCSVYTLRLTQYTEGKKWDKQINVVLAV